MDGPPLHFLRSPDRPQSRSKEPSQCWTNFGPIRSALSRRTFNFKIRRASIRRSWALRCSSSTLAASMPGTRATFPFIGRSTVRTTSCPRLIASAYQGKQGLIVHLINGAGRRPLSAMIPLHNLQVTAQIPEGRRGMSWICRTAPSCLSSAEKRPFRSLSRSSK